MGPLAGGDARGTVRRAPLEGGRLDRLLEESLSPGALAQLPPEAHLASSEAEWPAPVDVGAARTTRRQYRSRVSLFAAWCVERRVRAIPAHPEALRLYLVWLAATGHSWSTIKVSQMAIGAAHRARGHDAPMSARLRAALREVRRGLTRRPWALNPATLRAILATCSRDALGSRDRALLLVTYSAKLSPGETVALDLTSAERRANGYLLSLPRTRSRKEERVPILVEQDPELCSVRALDDWIDAYARAANLHPPRGPLFVAVRGGNGYPIVLGGRIAARTVRRVLRGRALAAGIDLTTLAVHSLDAGAPAITRSPD